MNLRSRAVHYPMVSVKMGTVSEGIGDTFVQWIPGLGRTIP